MCCVLNMDFHSMSSSTIVSPIQNKISCVLKGTSSTVEYQTVELERELEKVKSKKTNLGNILFSYCFMWIAI